MGCGFSSHCADSRVGPWLNPQEPGQTSQEALVRQLHQGPDSESSSSGHGAHCSEIPYSGALTAGSLDPVPDTGGPLLFIFINVFIFICFCKNI